MKTRLDLQELLEELLGYKHVYYQPPESLKMEYPAIVYSKDDIETDYGDNLNYINHVRYEIIVIDKLPDNKVIDKILQLPMSSFNRHYSSNNFNHDVLILYI